METVLDVGIDPPRGALVVSPAPRAAWQECYDNDPTALVTQSPGWLDAMRATGRWVDVSRH